MKKRLKTNRRLIVMGALFFASGGLELYLGIAQTMPIAWVMGCIVGMATLIGRFVAALRASLRAAFGRDLQDHLRMPEPAWPRQPGNGIASKPGGAGETTPSPDLDGGREYERFEGDQVITEQDPHGDFLK